MREVDYVHMLLERRVDGMVFISAEITDVRSEHSHYGQLLERGARLVFVNGASESLHVTAVGVDERASGRIATEHLIELGHDGSASSPARPSRSRRARRAGAGTRRCSRQASTPGRTSRTRGSPSTAAAKRSERSSTSRTATRPTGVICSNDLMAIGAIQEAAALGLRVPEDLSIVGFDGIDAAAWTQPPLTTVEQPIDEIAETAIAALRPLIDAPAQTLPSYVFRPTLRVGGTTAPAP